MNKTEQIFKLTAPYHNQYQGSAPRLLFVCSVGLLRSPTFAEVAIKKGANARSCGSNTSLALIPLSANLIYWADKIIFMHKEIYLGAISTFYDYEVLINKKAISLNIEDSYERNDPELVRIAEKEIDIVLKGFKNA